MALSDLLPILVIALYFLGTAFFVAGTAVRNEKVKATAIAMAAAGFLLHSLDLALLFALEGGVALAAGRFLFSLLGWGMLLIFFLLWWRFGLKFLAVAAMPLALLFTVMATASTGVNAKLPPLLSGLFFFLHIGTLFASMALLAMGFAAGLAFLHLEKRIKSKSGLKNFQKDMPSLDTFDRVNHAVVLIGFPLYTLGLASGFVWTWLTASRFFTLDPKVIAALIIQALFIVLFHQRLALGWRGRKPAVMTIAVFLLTVVSMLGINFLVSSTFHGFKP